MARLGIMFSQEIQRQVRFLRVGYSIACECHKSCHVLLALTSGVRCCRPFHEGSVICPGSAVGRDQTLLQNALEAFSFSKCLLQDFAELESLLWCLIVIALLTEQNRVGKKKQEKNLAHFPTVTVKMYCLALNWAQRHSALPCNMFSWGKCFDI